MYIEERHEAILQLLKQNGSISTADIQKKFLVGYESAKRDLRILEEKGLLKREKCFCYLVGWRNG